MAEKGWTGRVGAATAVAAGMGAAQLGIGYGLSIVRWPGNAGAGDGVWLASLGWATWIAASSTIVGAVAGSRLRAADAAGAVTRIMVTLAAALGALLTVALVAVPARFALRTGTFSPQMVAAGYAMLGILLGIVVAFWAIGSRPVAANVIGTVSWLWTLAIATVLAGLVLHRPESGIHLGDWRITGLADRYYGNIAWPSAILTLSVALIIGLITAWPAARRDESGLSIAASGAVGPLLMAAAYLALSPQLSANRGVLTSTYLIAPYAVLAGLAGSALAVALGGPKAASVRQSAVIGQPAGEPVVATTDPAPRDSSTAAPPVPAGTTSQRTAKDGAAGTAVSEKPKPARTVAARSTSASRSRTTATINEPINGEPAPTNDEPAKETPAGRATSSTKGTAARKTTRATKAAASGDTAAAKAATDTTATPAKRGTDTTAADPKLATKDPKTPASDAPKALFRAAEAAGPAVPGSPVESGAEVSHTRAPEGLDAPRAQVTTPLWLEDEKLPKTDEQDGFGRRLRRLGRRGGSTDS